jgi:hypothetical protein
MQRSVTTMFTSNFKTISLSICGGSNDYEQMSRLLDLSSFIKFVLVVLLFVVFNLKTILANMYAMFNKRLYFRKSYKKVWGRSLGNAGERRSQRRYEQNTSPKRSIWRCLGDALGDTAGDALTTWSVNSSSKRK